MLILRCTQKLRMKNLGPVGGRQDSLVPTLGTWHANLIYLANSPIVICVNDRSLLSVIVRGRQFPTILSAITARIGERFGRMGLAEELISREHTAMEVVEVLPSNSKSVLASMNNFVQCLKFQVPARFNIDQLDELEVVLSETPMGTLDYQFPVEVAYQLFGVPEEEFRSRVQLRSFWSGFAGE